MGRSVVGVPEVAFWLPDPHPATNRARRAVAARALVLFPILLT